MTPRSAFKISIQAVSSMKGVEQGYSTPFMLESEEFIYSRRRFC